MKAWQITLWGVDSTCYGETRGKAVYSLWLGISDISQISFGDFLSSIKTRRAPELDKP